jgi:phosphoribosylglycinamide formyltransferase-1
MSLNGNDRCNPPLGIIGSSGGSALSAAVHCIHTAELWSSFVVVADRECGLLDWAKKENNAATRLPYLSAEQFSEEAFAVFKSAGVQQVLLFYTRRITGRLIDEIAVWNIHPSLLPAFPGMGCLKKTIAAGVRMLGATLHRADEHFDSGPIYAQTGCRLPPDSSLACAAKISFLQKTWLTLIWYELASGLQTAADSTIPAHAGCPLPAPINAFPSLIGQGLVHAFDQLQRKEGCHVIDIRS